MSESKRKPGFFSRLFSGAKNLFRKIAPVATSVMSVVDPDYGKLKNLAGNILTSSRGARLSKGLSRITDISTKIAGGLPGVVGVAPDWANKRMSDVISRVQPEGVVGRIRYTPGGPNFS